MIGRYLGRILGLISVTMVPALLIALVRGEWKAFFAFLATAAVQGGVAYLLNKIPVASQKIYSREGLVIVALFLGSHFCVWRAAYVDFGSNPLLCRRFV